jgi:hypothetical protein
VEPKSQAREHALVRAWEIADQEFVLENRRPPRQRAHFQVQEIAEAVARLPGRPEINRQLCWSIIIDLFLWIQRGEFAAADVLMLIGGEPRLTPFAPALQAMSKDAELSGDERSGARRPVFEQRPRGVYVNLGAIILTRRATKQYLENCGQTGAERVLKEWFGASTAVGTGGSAMSGFHQPYSNGVTSGNSLADGISPLPEGLAQAVATPTKIGNSGRRRGPAPAVFDRVKKAMMADLQSHIAGETGKPDPRKMLQKNWLARCLWCEEPRERQAETRRCQPHRSRASWVCDRVALCAT